MFHIHMCPKPGQKYVWRIQDKNPYDRFNHIVIVEEVKNDWVRFIYSHSGVYHTISRFWFHSNYKLEK